jgi:hypothetical protein
VSKSSLRVSRRPLGECARRNPAATLTGNAQTVQVVKFPVAKTYLHAPIIIIIGSLRPDEIRHLYGLRVTRQSGVRSQAAFTVLIPLTSSNAVSGAWGR